MKPRGVVMGRPVMEKLVKLDGELRVEKAYTLAEEVKKLSNEEFAAALTVLRDVSDDHGQLATVMWLEAARRIRDIPWDMP